MTIEADLISDFLATDEMDTELEAYASSADALAAVKKMIQRSTPDIERSAILGRLRASGPLVLSAVPTMLSGLRHLPAANQQEALAWLEQLAADRADLSNMAEEIGALLNIPTPEIRHAAVDILVKLGPLAVGAAMPASGCTRHADPSIRQAGLRVLGAIGPACPPAVVRRLKTLTAPGGNLDDETRAIAVQALRSIQKCECTPERDDTKQFTTRMMAPNASETQVIKLVGAIGKTRAASGKTTAILNKVRGLNGDSRRRVLLCCLGSKDPGTRAISARMMIEEYRAFLSFGRIVHQAYQREKNHEVRESLADLLTMLLSETGPARVS